MVEVIKILNSVSHTSGDRLRLQPHSEKRLGGIHLAFFAPLQDDYQTTKLPLQLPLGRPIRITVKADFKLEIWPNTTHYGKEHGTHQFFGL